MNGQLNGSQCNMATSCFCIFRKLSLAWFVFNIFPSMVPCRSEKLFNYKYPRLRDGETTFKNDKFPDKSINTPRTIRLYFDDFNLNQYFPLALTTEAGKHGTSCNDSHIISKNIHALNIQGSSVEVEIRESLSGEVGDIWYLCVGKQSRQSLKWMHVGKYAAVSPEYSRFSDASSSASRSRRKYKFATFDALMSFSEDVQAAKVFGIRGETEKDYITEEGYTQIIENVNSTIRIFGTNFSLQTEVAFTSVSRPRGTYCDDTTHVVHVKENNFLSSNVVQIYVSLPILMDSPKSFYYLCIKETLEKGEVVRWVHQGDKPWVTLEVVGRMLPMWLQILIICFLLILSGLFSGLNLGLMALDKTELQVIENCGTEKEKKYARTISPLRKRGNYLLCSLLLGNVLVNSTLTILLDDLTSGIVAIIGSTMSIVVFGEIIPQAICSRHGLAIGARTVWVTKFFMMATFPLSFPISKLLDLILGEEIGNVYDRERLMEFIRVTKDYNKLENEEVNIISGALELKKKTVSDVMTKIEDVFMVPFDAVLNFETMSEIMKQGYSRIPVYDSDRNNIAALLNIKDLAFVDPDDNSPLRTLCEFYNHPINYVFEDETLDVMLNEFKKGQSHMAFVRHINNEGDGDPFYEIIGVVTLEDVIEEILQSEIIDETDILTDNRRKQRRKEAQLKQDFSDFAKIGGGQQGKNIISPQLALATYQYLSTSVEPFKKMYLSETVLKRLMTQNIFFNAKNNKEDNSLVTAIYQAGKPADYFVLILEGRCKVTVGKENLVFESGPFTYFGIPAITVNTTPGDSNPLSQPLIRGSSQSITVSPENPTTKTFIPDYTVTVVTQTLFMKIHWGVYLAAYRATLMERQQKFDPSVDDPFRTSWEQDVNFTNSSFSPMYQEAASTRASSSNLAPSPPQPSNSRKIILSPVGNRTSAIHANMKEEPAKRRASVEVGCISRCPETVVIVDGLLKCSKVNPLTKTGSSAVSGEIPMVDMPHNLNSVVEDDSSHSSVESVKSVPGSKIGDVKNGKKRSPLNGSTEHTSERTRLLYPSEA